MKRIVVIAVTIGLAALTGRGQSTAFLPGHLAVLQAGDGALSLHLKQSPAYIDEFTPGAFNSTPLMSVAIPTNGADTIFFNGHASTEGMLNRSSDGKLLSFAGYGGVNLLQESGTPSTLDIGRAFCTVDAAAKTHTIIYDQYSGAAKMNPRGVVTDGANHFWSCGNSGGTAYYDADNAKSLVIFSAVPDSRQVKIINGVLYTSLNGPDGVFLGVPSGIFSFVDEEGNATPLPQAVKTKLSEVVQSDSTYSKIAGFDMNPQGDIAYTADAEKGIQKYVKSNGQWKFVYNFSIRQNIPDDVNHEKGCFALTVDFSSTAPVIYATTTEGYDGCVNSNRVVQIVDTNSSAIVTTVAQSPSENIVYRGIAFTPLGK
jgi:hypothetical protein